ncbi:alpha/beta fold hydrolase [Deinococcus psychrotolerans]|uniref:Alpha/beta fold hydrolase n=1 Tax=Deinococcus psychrotolerans TaxID=2489213 RepID=A0A3G8YDH0_9DEIO|nr:alpha/beta fold hydrolase [Deinococcus psychrotolerans]AZI42277.1 alpha/beta fold hydrolase [Deinococcus psychrotolerans]
MTAAESSPQTPTPHFVDVGGVRTRHVIGGEGPPIVLLHGIGRSLEDFAPTVQALFPAHRVYAPDMIGFGYTDKPEVNYSLPGLARFVRHYLDAVGETRPVTLIGNSLGGAVAQTFAVMYPQRARGLVLVNSAGFGREVAVALRLCAVPGLGERLLVASPTGARRVTRSLFVSADFVTPERVAHTLNLSKQPGAARAFLSVLRSIGDVRGARTPWQVKLAQQLPALNLPTLIVWGDRDEILPVRHLEAARRTHPHATVHLFEATGHVPQIEREAEFTAILNQFLEHNTL